MTRIIWRIAWDGEEGRWALTRNGHLISRNRVKEFLEKEGRRRAHTESLDDDSLITLIVQTKTGDLQRTFNYGYGKS